MCDGVDVFTRRPSHRVAFRTMVTAGSGATIRLSRREPGAQAALRMVCCSIQP